MCEPTVIVHSAIFLGVWTKLMGAICFGNVPGTCCGLETTRRVTRNAFSHWRFYDAHHPTQCHVAPRSYRITMPHLHTTCHPHCPYGCDSPNGALSLQIVLSSTSLHCASCRNELAETIVLRYVACRLRIWITVL